MSKPRRVWYLLAAVVLVVVLVWAGLRLRPQNQEPIPTLRVGAHTTILGAALDITAARGYFENHGLRVTLDHQESSKITMPALLSGSLVIAIGSNSAGSFNHLSTGRIRILADAARIIPRLLVRKALVDSHGVTGIPDLRGHTIRVPREGSASHFALHRILSTYNVPDSEVDLSFQGEQIALAELQRGELDAAILNEPYASEAIERGIVVEPWARELAKIFGVQGEQHMVLFVNRDYADANPETIERFLDAYRDGINDYLPARINHMSRPDIIEVIANYTGATSDVVVKAEWPWISPDAKPSLAALRESQRFFLETGLLERPSELVLWTPPSR